MAKLVLLSAGMSGRTHELNVERTTVGRLEDNTLQIPEPSVSSHHCEILVRGTEILVKDLNSTNGTFIGGEKISEAVLKPGQVLRLGQIELRLENGQPPGAPAGAGAAAPGRTPPTKHTQSVAGVTRGVSLNELEQGTKAPAFDTVAQGFSKKDNKVNKIFIIAGIVIGVVIAGLLLYVFAIAGN